MGKKAKKTRWRTLTLNGHQSDSEESSSKSLQTSKPFQHKYSKFPYSSQSTPIRKFQHESSKSTRSNSTTSEHKATFNEDEYTRITTPRQDVLFKKGYLNKPKSYQTQTSTGTSSTANSTSTCTPDHQSADGTEGTDLEYESQFVFPNGFIDQNGIYYINSFEPFPFVVYNAPICYSEYPSSRSKRYSTDSLAESMSPHNEESSQEPSQSGAGDRTNNTPVFSQTYLQPSGYYYNGVCTASNGQYVTEEPRRLKKRRRRKVSRSKSSHEDATSEGTDEYDSSDEVFSQPQGATEHRPSPNSTRSSSVNRSLTESHHVLEVKPELNHDQVEGKLLETIACHTQGVIVNGVDSDESEPPQPEHTKEPNDSTDSTEENEVENPELIPMEDNRSTKSNISDAQNLLLQSLLKNAERSHSPPSNPDKDLMSQPISDIVEKSNEPENQSSNEPSELTSELADMQSHAKYSLKPDAEEFIPRTFRPPEALPFDPNVQFLNLPPNFIPIPFVNHLGELQRPPFLPPGIPLNFVPPQDAKVLPNFVNLVPNGTFVPKLYHNCCEVNEEAEIVCSKSSEQPEAAPTTESQTDEEENKPKEETKPPETIAAREVEVVHVKKLQTKNEIDIAKIVSKLEEAAKQQRFYEHKRQNYNRSSGRYNTSRPYPSQRVRYNKHYSENRQYSENRYPRSRPNSLDKQHYERNTQKPEQNYQRGQRSKPTYELEDSSDTTKEEATLKSTPETHAQASEFVQNEHTQVTIEKRSDQSRVGQKRPERINNFQRKNLADHRPVNNVNNRLGERCSNEKDLKLESTSNYSELLKRNVAANNTTRNSSGSNTNKCVRYEQHTGEKIDKKPEEKVNQDLTPKPQRSQNQWISVSSRKKRKNKSANEDQNLMEAEEVEEEVIQSDDLFESFDISQLVDVVPPSQLNENINVKEEEKEPEVEMSKEAAKIQDVSEESIISNKDVQEETVEESAKIVDTTINEMTESVAMEEMILLTPKENNTIKLEKKKPSSDQKKKAKKGTQKPFTRRVIIKDMDLQLNKPIKDYTDDKTDTSSKNINEEAKPNISVLEPTEDLSNVAAEPSNGTKDEDLKSDLTQSNETIATEEDHKEEDAKPVELENKEMLSTNIGESTTIPPQLTVAMNTDCLNSSPNSMTQTSESDTIADTPEKKSKKKKKKTPKPTLVKIQSVSSSTTTLSTADDSYDFLLENSVLEDFEQKTNVEISQELDKMIQKGMYSSLEEKIRALRINAVDDGFFKTINYGLLPNQAVLEKPSAIKASNFDKMLKNTMQLLKTPEESDLIDIDFSKIKLPDLEPQPSTSKSGIFLQNPVTNELIKHATNSEIISSVPIPQEIAPKKSKDNGKLRNKSKKNGELKKGAKPAPESNPDRKPVLNGEQMEPKTEKGEIENGTIERESKNLTTSNTFSSQEAEPTGLLARHDTLKHDHLYPITQAVKEWMTKTRENTPDVEILKSPNTIFKEFYGSEAETESDSASDSKNGLGNPRPARSVSREKSPMETGGAGVAEYENLNNDEEVTIWSVSPQNSVVEDLLDCWENEMANGKGEEPGQIETKHVGKNALPNGVKTVPVIFQNGNIKEIKGSVHNGHLNGHVDEGEDAIEVYESKYGKNEDFLKLKAEIEEQKGLNFPKHGNLPYRAICCSIM